MPAHQDMQIGCIGWWEGSGVVCATHPTPSWGQAPALHFSCDPRLSLFGRRWLVSPAGAGVHSSRIGVRDMLSYQSLMLAGAGTPRYANWMHWLVGEF